MWGPNQISRCSYEKQAEKLASLILYHYLISFLIRVEKYINIIQIYMSEIIITGITVFEKSDNDFCHIVAVVWHCEKNLLTLG